LRFFPSSQLSRLYRSALKVGKDKNGIYSFQGGRALEDRIKSGESKLLSPIEPSHSERADLLGEIHSFEENRFTAKFDLESPVGNSLTCFIVSAKESQSLEAIYKQMIELVGSEKAFSLQVGEGSMVINANITPEQKIALRSLLSESDFVAAFGSPDMGYESSVEILGDEIPANTGAFGASIQLKKRAELKLQMTEAFAHHTAASQEAIDKARLEVAEKRKAKLLERGNLATPPDNLSLIAKIKRKLESTL
ncbi:MAG: hypothetical protein ACK481_08775, partial [Candidatus Melainabacteria bacterium]